MVEQSELVRLVKASSKEDRKKKLMSFKETELHYYLKELFQEMEPDYAIEITHKAGELGKDLVIVKKDHISTDVIGVVVKKGHIRGKTAGQVDEVINTVKVAFSYAEEKKLESIESQVQQAFAHRAEMKMIFNKLPVSKVFIVLVGNLSNQARDRLIKELRGYIIEVKDINWLIDNFSDYYPQVFFEGQVIDFLQQKIQELETKHWLFFKRKINLSDYFVEPLVEPIDSPLAIDKENLILSMGMRRTPFSKLKSIIKQARRIILIGNPGVGKSNALAKMAIDMLREAHSLTYRGISKKQIGIPVLISAKEILGIDDCETLLQKYYVTPDIINRFKVQTLMIDALDEVPSTQANDVIEKAEEFSKHLACSLIITSRKIDIIKVPPIGFEKYELLPFEYSQALKLCEKLIRSKKILTSLKDGLEKIRFQIPMVPLSLMLLIELVEEEREIPASIAELYNRFFDLMLGRWDKEKGIEVLFEYIIKGSFLAELAFKEFYEKKRMEISQKEFEEFLNNYASRYDWDREELKGFIKEIERAGILAIRETVIFRHRSFLDYSAAHYIFNKRAEFENLNDFIVKIYFDITWGEIAFFYIGLMREISDKIIEKIFAVEEEEIFIYIDKLLLGRLLQAGWHIPTKRKYNGIKRAVTFAPAIREEFLKIAKQRGVKIPKIMGDCLVMILSDLAFGSMVLYKEAKSLFSDLFAELNEDYLCQMLSILWAIQRFYEPEKLASEIKSFIEMLPEIPDLSVEEHARSLLILELIGEKNKPIVKTIKRKLEQLINRYPETFKELLPLKRKGFRRIKKE